MVREKIKSNAKKITDYIKIKVSFLLIICTPVVICLISYIIIKSSPLFYSLYNYFTTSDIYVLNVLAKSQGAFITDATSAQYILSALAQSQAAIIAIVFTALLITFQMSVKLNSKKMAIDDFLKSRSVIFLIGFYAYSIGYDLILLNMIDTKDSKVNVFLPILVMVALIFFLIPSIRNMMKYMHKQVIAGEARAGVHKHLDRVDLKGAFLADAKLSKAKLTNAKLCGANLQSANLSDSTMINTDLCDAKLCKADLRGANLERAIMNKCHLNSADLRGSFLENAQLIEAKMKDLDLNGAGLRFAKLSGNDILGCYMNGANLDEAEMNEVTFKNSYLNGAKLFNTNLKGASLENINLNGVNLENADLTGANLSHAILNGANLSGTIFEKANLEGTQMHGAKIIDAKFDFNPEYVDANTPNIPEFEKLGLSVKGLKTDVYIDETLGEVDLNHVNLRRKNLGKLYLFSWNQVSMEYEPLLKKYVNLLDFLRGNYGNYWTDMAVIKKTNYGKIIICNRKLSNKNISLELIENENKVKLKIDGVQSIDLILQKEDNKLNVYQKFVYHGSNFEGAKLCSANLIESELSGCMMNKSELIQIIAEKCKLNGANMVEADLRLANLRKAELNGASLSCAILTGADLTGAQLNGAKLNEAIFAFTDSNGITMDGFKLPGKNILYKINLKGTNLHKAQLNGVNLENAKLMGVDLSDATLIGATLKGADLRGADLRGTDFSAAILEDADFRETKQDKNTNFSGASHSPTIQEI